ncbi:type II toxin-antitoxin system antitoxin DNA ADP-ribosyl glycohydrolase DarG [Flexistipes sp.]|uniref:type II toxin-antitoxin system antitoxin DNA ADP-ribosyl glycohydrolase DarG n=1 Tax=Flexistipes sp. TaxID=3088135 RepID=UPI002E202599|nr:macro domain-containing protein [Flexistipes sp.]
MIEYKQGNILEEQTDALVNTVNCVGVMGRGIAYQFKKSFPENFKAYVDACKHGKVQPGQMFVFKTNFITKPKYIINFPTKRHWKGKSRIEDIEKGIDSLVETINKYNISSIALPPLGSGLGGLEWQDVKQLIEKKLSKLTDISIIIYEPAKESKINKKLHSKKLPNMTAGRAALIGLIDRYQKGLLDPLMTLIELHKLLYLMQEAGEQLKLKYQAAHYGPYAENLRHVLKAIEGYYIFGYGDGGDNPNKQLKLVPGSVEDAKNFLNECPNTRKNFEKVANLIEGFESSYGLELLTTVHWIIIKEKPNSFDKLVEIFYSWNNHKKQFTIRQIEIAVNILCEKGWVNHHQISKVQEDNGKQKLR